MAFLERLKACSQPQLEGAANGVMVGHGDDWVRGKWYLQFEKAWAKSELEKRGKSTMELLNTGKITDVPILAHSLSGEIIFYAMGNYWIRIQLYMEVFSLLFPWLKETVGSIFTVELFRKAKSVLLNS